MHTPPFHFAIQARDSHTNARAGLLYTPHGSIATPVFMPVGTQATVKTLSPRSLTEAGVQILLTNAYHLSLRPGIEVIARLGGIHHFMGWSRPILTDSGGFQIFSLAHHRTSTHTHGSLIHLTDEGAWFTSPIDGTRQFISPEYSMDMQAQIGADIIMALDECSRNNNDESHAAQSLRRTHTWLLRCLDRWQSIEQAKRNVPPQALFGIVQGGNSRTLREEGARFVASLGLPGIAIGGESIGYSLERTTEILEWILPFLPENRPRYAMGVGDPEAFFAVIRRGIDMFDCVYPTRLARHGTFLTTYGRLRITASEAASNDSPPDPTCRCYTCQNFSRAYLRHLFKASEPLALSLASLHNVHFCVHLVDQIRTAIIGGYFVDFEIAFLTRFREGTTSLQPSGKGVPSTGIPDDHQSNTLTHGKALGSEGTSSIRTPRHFLIMGPPQAGKGTQAALLAEHFSLLHLATGNLLREIAQENTDRGRTVNSYLTRGEYVPDSIVTALVIERMNVHDVLLDGYPRTVTQAESLDQLGIRIDKVLLLRVEDSVLIQRAAERLTCPQCGAVYSLSINPPATPWICDVCGSGLAQRLDDNPTTVRHRLRLYYERSEPVVDWYRNRHLVHEVDGSGSIEGVQHQLRLAVAAFFSPVPTSVQEHG